MNAIAYNLMSGRKGTSNGAGMVDLVLKTAMNLEQWDVRVPETANSDTATLYRVFQSVNNATDITSVRKDLNASFLQTIRGMLDSSVVERTLRSRINTLGVLAEIDDVVTSVSAEQLGDAWGNTRERGAGLISARYVALQKFVGDLLTPA